MAGLALSATAEIWVSKIVYIVFYLNRWASYLQDSLRLLSPGSVIAEGMCCVS